MVLAVLLLELNALLSIAVLIMSNSGFKNMSQKVRYNSGGIPSHPGDWPLFILPRAFLSSSREIGELSDSDLLSVKEGRSCS